MYSCQQQTRKTFIVTIMKCCQKCPYWDSRNKVCEPAAVNVKIIVLYFILQSKTSSDTKKYRTILGMMVVFIVFITFWTPLSIAGFADFNGRLPADYFVAAWSFAMLNSCLNTFVYAWLNQKFRRAYKLLLSRKWRQLQTDSLNNVSFSTA